MVNIAFFMIFAVLDPSPLTVCINVKKLSSLKGLVRTTVANNSLLQSIIIVFSSHGFPYIAWKEFVDHSRY